MDWKWLCGASALMLLVGSVASAEGVTLTDVRPDELGSVLPGQEVFLHARLQGTPRSFDVSVAAWGVA